MSIQTDKEEINQQASRGGIIVDLSKTLPDEVSCDIEDFVGINVATDGTSVQIHLYNDEESPGTGPALTTAQEAKYDQLNAIVHRHKQSFYAVGCALRIILQEKLYRKQYRSFDEYCKKEHGFGRSHGYRLVDGANEADEMSQTGDTLPENLNQALASKKAKQAPANSTVRPKKEVENDDASNVVPMEQPAHLASHEDILDNAKKAHDSLHKEKRPQEALKLLNLVIEQLRAHCEWEKERELQAA